MANFCSKCGAKIDSNAKFCARCGQPVSAPAGRTAAQRPSQPQGASQRTLNPQGASQRPPLPQGAPQRPSQPQSAAQRPPQPQNAAQRNLYPQGAGQGAAPGAGVQQPYYRQPAAPSYQNPPAKKSSAGLILMIIAIALFVILLVQLAIAGFVRPGWFKADAGSTQYVAAVESENVGEILPDGTEAAVF